MSVAYLTPLNFKCVFSTILKEHLNPISNYHAKFQAGTVKNSIQIKIYKYLGRFL